MLLHLGFVLCCLFSITICAVIIENTNKKQFKYFNPISDEKLLKEDKDFWYNVGGEYLEQMLKFDQEIKRQVAKNVVILIGDGMSISTITATRIYKGQRAYGKSGEDYRLIYDAFPNVALVKTYNVDMQVPDSAGTATALFTGIKTRFTAIGVDLKPIPTVPDQKIFEESKLEGIMNWAQRAKKDTGIITTTRITDATPASTYANVHTREWECDSKIPEEFKSFVNDIAWQLVEDAPGNNFKVIMGGGYQQFGHSVEDINNSECVRKDGVNLTQVWKNKHKDFNTQFVTNNKQLESVGDDTDYLLGLFSQNHLPYELIRDKGPKGTPSLSEMTRKGLKILKKNQDGFVLMVEGGRIDHAHHENYARLALEESAEFEKTISLVVQETGPDTLIIVTADHSHTMTINGYSKRGNDILGYGLESETFKSALTLTYANGPGFAYHYNPNSSSILKPWIDVRRDENRLNNPRYRHLAALELHDETHSGEDVGIFATGPGSHLIRGVIEQNYVAHLVSYAACIGPRAPLNSYCSAAHNFYAVDFLVRLNLLFLSILIICILC